MIEFTLYWNNNYELDGRNPNGFAWIARCFRIDIKKYIAHVENSPPTLD